MSNGGSGESSRGIESSLRKKKRRTNDEFAQSIARVSVAQVCESVGLQGFQQSALDTLSDIACRYIRDIGRTSNLYANSAGRTESNVLDIVRGLEDLDLSQGFAGASDINHCLLGSGVMKEISQYVTVSEEIGFAYAVPSFPVVKALHPMQSFLQVGETPPTEDIPPWLPSFPDPKTYASLLPDNSDKPETRQDRVDQDLKVNETLPLKLKQEQRRVCNGFQESAFVEQGENGGREGGEHNPFLAAPLPSGVKEVSLVSLPAKLMEEDVENNRKSWANLVSAMGTFAPAAQAFKKSECDDEEGSRMVLLNGRSPVQLKFQKGKQSLGTAIGHNKMGNMDAVSWFVNDEATDGKKRRTEKTLKEPSETERHTGNASVVN